MDATMAKPRPKPSWDVRSLRAQFLAEVIMLSPAQALWSV